MRALLRPCGHVGRVLALGIVLAGMALTPVGLSAPRAALADASPAPPISIGTVSGSFYANSNHDNGLFDVSQGTAPLFTQTFPTIDFNPPANADVQQHCSTPTGVNEYSRPFTDVDPNRDGSCTNIVAQGNGLQAGVGTLDAFEAVFTSTLTVNAPGQVTFNLYSDDGWVLSAGSDAAGDQPTYLSGSLASAPAQGPMTGYRVVGAYNQVSAPAQNTVTVNFPAAGTYPIELDYTECCHGQLALVLGTSYANPIVPQNPQAGLRQIVFVHGINGNFRDIFHLNANGQPVFGDYGELNTALADRYGLDNVAFFPYYQDRGYALGGSNPPTCDSSQAMPAADTRAQGTIPVQTDSQSVNATNCDSQSDLGIDATMLDDAISARPDGHGPVAVIAHSMGGAITRGWLALAQTEGSGPGTALSKVDTVVTFQGAQQGAYGANIGAYLGRLWTSDQNAGGWFIPPILSKVQTFVPFYVKRPVITELAPQSTWYSAINPRGVPAQLNYFNFYSDIQFQNHLNIAWWRLDGKVHHLGDLVMLPGTDAPTDVPAAGGARFLPGGVNSPASGPNRYEWALANLHDLTFSPNPDTYSRRIAVILGDPRSHFKLSGHLSEKDTVPVPDCKTGQTSDVTDQILNVLADPTHACRG